MFSKTRINRSIIILCIGVFCSNAFGSPSQVNEDLINNLVNKCKPSTLQTVGSWILLVGAAGLTIPAVMFVIPGGAVTGPLGSSMSVSVAGLVSSYRGTYAHRFDENQLRSLLTEVVSDQPGLQVRSVIDGCNLANERAQQQFRSVDCSKIIDVFRKQVLSGDFCLPEEQIPNFKNNLGL